jgi:hypothetical protein
MAFYCCVWDIFIIRYSSGAAGMRPAVIRLLSLVVEVKYSHPFLVEDVLSLSKEKVGSQ